MPLDANLMDYTVNYNKGHNYIYVHPNCLTNTLETLSNSIQVIWRYDNGKWFSAPKGSHEYKEMIKNSRGNIFYCKLSEGKILSTLVNVKKQEGLLITTEDKMGLVGYDGIIPVNADGQTSIISNDGSKWIQYPEQALKLQPGHAYWLIRK